MSSTGQIVGGVIGTVVGMWAGYPMLGAQLGILAGGLADPPKGPTTVGPRLADLTVQTSTYGAVIPRVYGTDAFSGNVFWLEGNAIKEVMVKKKSGGKGGGSKSTTKTFVNYATFAVGLCQGPIAGIRRIWIKGELFYDAGSSDPGTIAASNLAAEGFKVYLGTNTQSPDPRIQADVGAANCPAWRGLAYIVFYDLPLAKYGDALMGAQVKVEVFKTGTVSDYPHTYRSMPVSRNYWCSAWSGSMFCALAINTNICATSTDGVTWTEHTLPITATWYGIGSGNGIFVALIAGSDRCYTSPDGATWTERVLPAYGSSYAVAWNGSRFVIANASSQFWVSSDGSSWSGVSHFGGRTDWPDIVWNPTLGLFAVPSAAGSIVLTSPDGLTWTPHSTGIVNANWARVTCKDGRFLVTSSSNYGVLYSDDGSTWINSNIAGTPTGVNDVVADNANFVAFDNTHFYTSPDGINWASHLIGGDYWTAASWNGAVIVAFDYTHTFYQAITIIPRLVAPEVDTLDNIVSEECVRSGLLTAGDIDVSALTSTVRGYLVASTGTIRSAIEPLQAAWPFDVVQRGYKIKFLPRGGSSVVRIDADDLDARSVSGKPGVQITTSREMDSQLPRVLTIKHVDYDREYEAGEQYVERLNTDAINDVKMELPIVMTAGEAVGKAETLLYLRWLERFDVSFSIPGTYNQLEPGDVVTLETPEGDISLRLVAINYTSDGRLECRAKYNNAAIYTPAALASSPIVTGPSTLPLLGPTTPIFLDVPYMHPAQADPSFLMAMYGSSDTWPGAVLVRTDDYGSTWTEIQGFSSPGAAIGSASNTIGEVDSRVWDKGSVLSVSMLNGELFDATEIAVLNGGNHFAYGAPGRWEIIGVQKCTLVSAASYKLSDMLRGRKGTEWAMSLHAIGDKVVALSETDVTTIGMSSSAIGLERTYRAVTLDMEVEGAADQLFTYQGVNLECLSPVYFTGARTIATGDWEFSWIRRSRTDGEWRDLVDVGLGETTEAYELDIFTDNTYTTVKRTITATSPNCLYTSAQQVTDFGSNQSTVYAKVYQMSSVVGRGYPLQVELSAPGGPGYTVTITVPAASVSSNLTDFPLSLDLSLMSTAWWNSLWYRDGRDVRCFDSGSTPIPCDLVNLDPVARTGQLFVKTNLSSTVPTTLSVRVGQSSDGYVNPSDSIGRNNVWTNYHRVFTFGKDHVNRAGSQYLSANATTLSMDVTATSPNTSSHQGVACDGAHYYVSHTNKITKYDMSWSVVATNNDPVGDVGGGVNHLGDIDVVDGIIYGVIENYVNISTYSNMKLARFNASTLAYIDSVDVSAQGHEVSSVAYCDRDGYLYVSSYADGSKLWKYDRSTLAYVGALTLSSTVTLIQGVTYWNDSFWLSSGYPNNVVYRVEYGGSVRPQVWNSTSPTADFEGLGNVAGSLLLLIDVYGSSNNGVVNTLKPKTIGVTPAVKMTTGSDQFEYQTGLTRYTTWTVGATVNLASKTANMAVISYEVNGSTATTNRVTLAYRQSSDRFGLWNDTDGWLLDTVSPSTGTTYRLNASHNNTSGRKIYRNGGVAASAGTSTAKPGASADSILFGMENWAKLEDFDGVVGFAYIAPTLFSDAYVAAEYANLNSPATFYTVTG